MKCKKGISKTFEVIIAITIIITTYLIYFAAPLELPELEEINIRLRAFSALKSLDQQNRLREFALKNDTKSIEDLLADMMPFGINYKAQICEIDCPSLNIEAEKLTSVRYIISGDLENFKTLQIVLFLVVR